VKRPLDTTLGSTIPDAAGGEPPGLATFARPAERFELGAELGRGGMGRVIAAKDVSLERSVAIKTVLSDRPDDLARFEREVRITAQLEHPSIVPIHEAALDAEGRPYYVMRRIEGEPLSKRLSQTDLRARLALLPNLLAVIDAAAFAHARKIIHRDIKPSNILLGAYGETHLIDWGLARRLDDLDITGAGNNSGEQLTQVGHVYGTIGYMAPEQARGEAVDARADVFALGATLFHVLAGIGPFAGLSDAERMSAAVTGEDRVPLEKLHEDVPPELTAIIDKATAHDPDARYPHAGELAADVRAFLAGKLVAAHRYTTSQRLRRFVRRHRVVVALSAVSFAVIVVISALGLAGILREKRAAEEASERADQARIQAETRAELLQIQRASVLARTDPTRAAALLLQLPSKTVHAELARDTIAKVASSGVMRGAVGHTQQVNALAFAPDHRSLASVGLDGRVVIYDVARGSASTLVELSARLHAIEWLDERTLVVSSDQPGMRVIDVPTRTVRSLGENPIGSWWRVGTDRVRYHDLTTRTIREIALAGGPSRELVKDARHAVGSGSVALISTSKSTLLLDGERVRPLSIEITMHTPSFAISTDRRRVAVSNRKEVIEWDVESATETDRWNTYGQGLVYGPTALMVTALDRHIAYLYPKGRITNHPVFAAPIWNTTIASGLVLAAEPGTLHLIDAAGLHLLPLEQAGTRALAGSPDGMLVALGSRDGTVRWLDMAALTPPPIKLTVSSTLCTATTTHLYVIDDGSLLEIDLATAKRRVLVEDEPRLNLGGCMQIVNRRLLLFSQVGLIIIDLDGRPQRLLAKAKVPTRDEDRYHFAVEDKFYELGPDGPEQLLYTAPGPIDGGASRGRWLALSLADGRFLRVERATGAVVTIKPDSIGWWGIFPSGEIWLADDRRILLWDGVAAPRPLHTFSGKIHQVSHHADRFHVRLGDGTIWELTKQGQVQLRVGVGMRRLYLGALGIAVSFTPTSLTTHYLGSGEETTREIHGTNEAILLSDGRTAVARLHETALIFADPAPLDFAEAQVWLGRLTNARIDEPTSALEWRVH
jgi:hypothetical protein